MDFVLDFDPQTVCRICMSSDVKLLNLFTNTVVDGYLTAVPEMIFTCLDLRVNPKDLLPGKLCNTCKADVTSFYVFKQKSKRTDQLLRAMIPTAAEAETADHAEDPKHPTSPPLPPKATQTAVVDAAAIPEAKNSPPPPLQCEFCDKSLASESALSAHCMEQHATTGEADTGSSSGEDEQHLAITSAQQQQHVATSDLLSILTAKEDGVEDEIVPPYELDETDRSYNEHDDSDEDEYIISGPLEEAIADDDDADDNERLEEEHLSMDFEVADNAPTGSVMTIIHTCPECEHCFEAADEVSDHLRDAHGLHRCPKCLLTFSRVATLQRHRSACMMTLSNVEYWPMRSDKDVKEEEKVLDDGDDEDYDETALSEAQSYADTDAPADVGGDDSTGYQTPAKEPLAKRRKRSASVKSVNTSMSAAPRQPRAIREPMFCEVCDKVFTNQKRHEQHTRMHELMHVINNFMDFHPCHACRMIFAHADDLLVHRVQQHGCNAADDENDARDAAEAAAAAQNNALAGGRRGLQQAAEVEVGGNEETALVAVKPEQNDDGYTDYQFLEDDGYESGEYQCAVCYVSFGTSQETKYHLVNHVQRFDCPLPECGCQYDQFVRFALHITNKHINEAHRCTHCGVEHRSYDEMQAHIKSACAERKFACTHCDKKFFSNKALRNHLGWSKGKRHKCSHCGKEFTQAGELTIHRRMHTDERPFECTVCGKTYKTSSMRASHMDTHIPGKTFSCTICNTMLQTRTCYRNHMARHTKEKKEVCSYCQKRFFTRYHLRQHVANVHEKDTASKTTGGDVDADDAFSVAE